MIQNIISSTILIFLAILLILSQSCDFDQITSEYSDFKTANQNGFFEKGWIPSDLVFNSMTNIYQRTNLDLNFCVFNYNLSKIDLEKLKEYSEILERFINYTKLFLTTKKIKVK